MSVADNIGFGLKVRKRPKDQIRKRVGELLELINLPDKGGRYPYQLSGGQQQRVALARALAIEPEVLLLDEPLSALDAKIRVALRKEIRSIQRQLGITTVYVTHDQEEALSLSDRVVVMSEGRIEQIGPPPEIYNFPATPFVASFVGTLNLLTGRGRRRPRRPPARRGPGDPGGARTPRAGTGREVTVALRPEAVELGEGGGANRLTGRSRTSAFSGSIVRIRIRIGEDGDRLARQVQRSGPRRARASGRRSRSRSRPRRRSFCRAGRAPRRRSRRRSPRSDLVPAPSSREPATADEIASDLERIDLVVFDKDGTLISFEAMWGGWARRLGARLEATTRRPVSGDVFAAIGFDPVSGSIHAGGPLAIDTMAGIEQRIAAVLRRWCPSVPAARRALAEAWLEPDPVELALPLADLPELFGALRSSGRAIAVATTDNRGPTEATLAALGLDGAVATILCGDDDGPDQAGARRLRCRVRTGRARGRPQRDGRRYAGGSPDGARGRREAHHRSPVGSRPGRRAGAPRRPAAEFGGRPPHPLSARAARYLWAIAPVHPGTYGWTVARPSDWCSLTNRGRTTEVDSPDGRRIRSARRRASRHGRGRRRRARARGDRPHVVPDRPPCLDFQEAGRASGSSGAAISRRSSPGARRRPAWSPLAAPRPPGAPRRPSLPSPGPPTASPPPSATSRRRRISSPPA